MDRLVVEAAGLEARHRRQPLVVLHVIELSHDRPLEATDEGALVKAERILASAERLLPERRIEVRTEVCQSRAASTGIINMAIERGADRIVIGAHRFLGEYDCDLGATATTVLRRATVPVTVCYDPIR